MKTTKTTDKGISGIDDILKTISKPGLREKFQIMNQKDMVKQNPYFSISKRHENFMVDPLLLADLKKIVSYSKTQGQRVSRGDLINFSLKQTLPGIKKELGIK